MTSNQRRPGFRLPWSSEDDGAESQGDPNAPEAAKAGAATDARPAAAKVDTEPKHEPEAKHDPATEATQATTATADNGAAAPSAKVAVGAATTPIRARTQPAPAPPAAPEPSAGFMRDLVAAMRRVAEETRQAGLSELRTKAEEQVRTIEADADRRREELRGRAEADIAGVGEWEGAEAERIKQEAEQRVVGRRAQLDQQLAAETTRAEAEAKTLRDRVAEYERELDAYHAQLSDIADPAAFAAAAKRMPSAPQIAPPAATEPQIAPPAATEPEAAAPAPTEPDAAASADEAAGVAASTGGDGAAFPVHPAEEEVLASRLAELDATLDAAAPAAPEAPAEGDQSTATAIVVKGLGSFGAITGFRQSLAASEGIGGVSLSLGPTGEFVFRAIHGAGFDVAGAIKALEGDAAKVEEQADGALRVTLDRSR